MGPLPEHSKFDIFIGLTSACLIGWAVVESISYIFRHVYIGWN